ncbi:outer membrane beta-barrel protein [Tenacibaculum caenipelagi]|uniref:Outer membrane protein with beta-barrel domain n=1 Tax=Tenacibaculum caenipelagi TaxID=1325435 RepID=A0A4R6TFQ1_9FLAO|nr:outer membrane beta-barrel protein [Tenacibaculum caenipelagi]TDQ28653.1 outer membrane protein with beta-barrel domain [Tenacibaculum caenipelagi]
MEEKNIDRLFQERLKDLEVTPNEKVWNAIEEKLNKKKKKRVFPIWWFSGGIAATLVLGFLLYPYAKEQENTNEIETIIVESPTQQKNDKKELEDVISTEFEKENIKETHIVKEEFQKDEILNTDHVVNISKKELQEKEEIEASREVEGALLVQTNIEKEEKNSKKKLKEKLHENEVLTTNHVVKISKKVLEEKDNNQTSREIEGSLLVKSNVEKKVTNKKKKLKEKLHENEVLTTNHVVKISKNELQEKDSNIASRVVEGALLTKNDVVKEEEPTGKLENSLPVIKSEAQGFPKEKKSTLKEALKPKQELLAETEEEESIKEDKNSKKWSIAPVFAIVKSNSFSKESPLDSKLIQSPTNGSNNFSYGLKVAYQLNKRWEVQSGVQLQNFDYINDNVPVTNGFSSETLSSVDYKDEFSSFGFGTSTGMIGMSSTGFGIVNENATLTQSLGYIEVPVEIKYTFIDTQKFSSKVVTGFSSLFLNKNEVSVSSEKISETFGSVKNLNSVDFSGNLGIEFDYSINKQIKFNLNPMFKVQLNTFSSESNGFKPYTLGLYSGIKYQF